MFDTEFGRGLGWSFLAALFTGAFVIPWKLANEAGDAATSTLALLAAAALLNSLLVAGQRMRGPARSVSSRELGVALVLAGFTLFGNLASAAAIQRLSPALMNVVLRGDVLVVALFAWLLLGERVERMFWVGAAIAVGGLVLLQGPIEAGSTNLVGTGYALLALSCFSAIVIITRSAIHQIDPIAVNLYRLWASLPLWFLFNGVPAELYEVTRAQLGYAALAAFCGPFAGRLCLMISARHLDARITTLGVLSAPVLTLILEFVILGQVPPGRELIAGAIMMAGIALPLLFPGRRSIR